MGFQFIQSSKMSRAILFFASLILVVGLLQAQSLGGFNAVEKDKYANLLEVANKYSNWLIGDLRGYRLVTIISASSQVVFGTNFKLVGEFEKGSDRKTCEVLLIANFKNEIVSARQYCDD